MFTKVLKTLLVLIAIASSFLIRNALAQQFNGFSDFSPFFLNNNVITPKDDNWNLYLPNGGLTIGDIKNCDTIDTDGNGLLYCGTDQDTTDHGALTGLLDDDHTQYALTTGRAGESLTVQGDFITSLTEGSVPFIGSGGLLSQDNSNFFWNNTAKILGVGTSSPTATIDIRTASDSTKGLIIRNSEGQSVNLQEWQDGFGNPMTYINQYGGFYFDEIEDNVMTAYLASGQDGFNIIGGGGGGDIFHIEVPLDTKSFSIVESDETITNDTFYIYTETGDKTGDFFKINPAQGSGTFTGNYFNLQNNYVQKALWNYKGNIGLNADPTTASKLKIDDDGSESDIVHVIANSTEGNSGIRVDNNGAVSHNLYTTHDNPTGTYSLYTYDSDNTINTAYIRGDGKGFFNSDVQINGSLTTNLTDTYLPVASTSGLLTDSILRQSGSKLGVNKLPTTFDLEVTKSSGHPFVSAYNSNGVYAAFGTAGTSATFPRAAFEIGSTAGVNNVAFWVYPGGSNQRTASLGVLTNGDTGTDPKRFGIDITTSYMGIWTGQGTGSDGQVPIKMTTAGFNATTDFYISNSNNGGRIGVNTETPQAQTDIRAVSATTKGLIVRGYSSQTANLQEWQKSDGTIYSGINNNGDMFHYDNIYSYFGTGNDMSMWHDGTNNQIRLTNGSLQIGDGTNYTQIATDGTITLHGTAKTKKEIRIPIGALGKGASTPTEALRSIGVSGNVKKNVLQFSKVTQQDIYLEIHPNYEQDDGVNHELHLVWVPGTGYTSGNYIWKVEYLIKDESGDLTTGTPTTISVDVTPSNATDMIETVFPDTYDLNIGQVLFGHLYRDVASDNADDVGSINLIESEYTVNSLGE